MSPHPGGAARRDGPKTYGVTVSLVLVQRVVAPAPMAPASRIARPAASTAVAADAAHGPRGRAAGTEHAGRGAARPAVPRAAASVGRRVGGQVPLVVARPVPRAGGTNGSAGGVSGSAGESGPGAVATARLLT